MFLVPVGISEIVSPVLKSALLSQYVAAKFNKAFFLILFYVVIFPAIFAYYCWQKGIEIIGPNRATMFIQLMPLFSALMAIIIFKENFELFHFVGAAFIVSGIYLSNKKTNA